MLKPTHIQSLFRIALFTVALCIGTVSTASAANTPAHKTPWYAPLQSLRSQSTISCILYNESRSTEAHPNLKDTDPYQFGPFQFDTILWNRWSWAAGVGEKSSSWYLGSISLNAVTVPAYKSSLFQQSKVFAYVDRYDGLWPWKDDGCV